jgi:AraC-like DNA-binding protein
MLPSLPLPIFGAFLMGFLALQMLLARERSVLLVALLALCAVQSALIAVVQHYEVTSLRFFQPIVASVIPPLVWITMCRLGATVTSQFWVHLLWPIIALVAILVQPHVLDVLIPVLYIGYGTAIVLRSLKGADALPHVRLESGEASGRIWRWIGAALICSALVDIAIVAAIIAGFETWRGWSIGAGSSGMLLMLSALSLSRAISDVPEKSAETDAASQPSQSPTPEDADIIARLDVLMEEGRLYLDPDLTLTRIARKLALPSKTLSSAINRATGENVSRYINARRIAAACRALDQGESVIEAMLSAGFNTKSNFNREFLRITGKTPREYRQ